MWFGARKRQGIQRLGFCTRRQYPNARRNWGSSQKIWSFKKIFATKENRNTTWTWSILSKIKSLNNHNGNCNYRKNDQQKSLNLPSPRKKAFVYFTLFLWQSSRNKLNVINVTWICSLICNRQKKTAFSIGIAIGILEEFWKHLSNVLVLLILWID